MNRPDDKIIHDAAYGDGASLAKIHKYLKEYSASLTEVQKDHLYIEKSNIILKGMDYRMEKEKMEAWGMLLDEMVKQIRSEEIGNLN